jgi:DNA invertase Pin-like site-specific DNA recombinase
MPFVRAYLRASTLEQDAARAKQQLESFAADKGLEIASYYIENMSGAQLERPELMRMLKDSKKGDLLLVEQIDRLSRLKEDDWKRLRMLISDRGLRIVALDLPTTWTFVDNKDDISARILGVISDMLLDLLAAFARKDYEDRRRRQLQGIQKAKAAKVYNGRPPNVKKHEAIRTMLKNGVSWSIIEEAVGVSRGTINAVRKAMANAENNAN